MHVTSLGRSSLQVPRLGVGAMTWGDARGLARLHPAQLAYGGAHGYQEEQAALEASLAAGVTLFDTAAIYGGGAAQRRRGRAGAAAGRAGARHAGDPGHEIPRAVPGADGEHAAGPGRQPRPVG